MNSFKKEGGNCKLPTEEQVRTNSEKVAVENGIFPRKKVALNLTDYHLIQTEKFQL